MKLVAKRRGNNERRAKNIDLSDIVTLLVWEIKKYRSPWHARSNHCVFSFLGEGQGRRDALRQCTAAMHSSNAQQQCTTAMHCTAAVYSSSASSINVQQQCIFGSSAQQQCIAATHSSSSGRQQQHTAAMHDSNVHQQITAAATMHSRSNCTAAATHSSSNAQQQSTDKKQQQQRFVWRRCLERQRSAVRNPQLVSVWARPRPRPRPRPGPRERRMYASRNPPLTPLQHATPLKKILSWVGLKFLFLCGAGCVLYNFQVKKWFS